MARRPKPWKRRGRGYFVQLHGKQVPLGQDKKLAYQRYHELMAQPEPATVLITRDEPFVVVCDAFLEWTKSNRAPRTFRWYLERLQSFVDHLRTVDRHLLAKCVKPLHVEGWLQAHPTWNDTTRRASIIAVQRCFNWAEKMQYVDRSPMKALEKPKAKARNRIVSAEEYQALLDNADAAFKDLLTAAWDTGARPQELLRVEARHFEERHARWVFPPDESKGKKKPRVVYLTPAVLEFTKRLAKKYRQGPLFRNRNGKAWNAYAVNCRFQRIRLKLNVSLCLYNFRHSYATRLLQSGLDALTVALLLGHSNPSTLAVTYQHLGHNPTFLRQRLLDAAS